MDKSKFLILYALFALISSPILRGENYSAIKKNEEGYYGQCQQDKYLNEAYFKNKRRGTFVEIGAHNGVAYSNTKFFEDLGWKGICIEPIPEVFEELKTNRKALCIQGCISDKPGKAKFLHVKGPEMLSGLLNKYEAEHLKRVHREVAEVGSEGGTEVIEVDCFLLNDILEQTKTYHVDLLSIDTEGGELGIIKSIDYDKFDIDLIDVENNYNCPEIKTFLTSKGYSLVINTGWDEIYKKNS